MVNDQRTDTSVLLVLGTRRAVFHIERSREDLPNQVQGQATCFMDSRGIPKGARKVKKDSK